MNILKTFLAPLKRVRNSIREPTRIGIFRGIAFSAGDHPPVSDHSNHRGRHDPISSLVEPAGWYGFGQFPVRRVIGIGIRSHFDNSHARLILPGRDQCQILLHRTSAASAIVTHEQHDPPALLKARSDVDVLRQ